MSIELARAKRIRFLRNRLLAESDWTQLPDSPFTTEKKAEWATYRQQLRDISSASGFPMTIELPQKPS